jgi:hypothetical protein
VLLWWDWRRRDCLGFDGRLLSFGCLLPFPLSTERCCQGFRGERLRPLLGISWPGSQILSVFAQLIEPS